MQIHGNSADKEEFGRIEQTTSQNVQMERFYH